MILFICNTLLIMQLTVLTLAIAVGALAQVSDSQTPVGYYHTEHTKNLSRSQFSNVTYPDGVSPNPNAILGAQTNQTSPPRYPSPFGSGAGEWAEAYKKAINIVEQLTLEEKVNLTTGRNSLSSPKVQA
jgi:beta-glucosidase